MLDEQEEREEDEHGDREEDAPSMQIGGDGEPWCSTPIGMGSDPGLLELVWVFPETSDK